MNIPAGFGPGESGDVKPTRKTVKAAASQLAKMSLIAEEQHEEEEEGSGSESEGEHSDSSSFAERTKAVPVGARPPNETAEEKRLRKLRVKEQRKSKRVSKKELKAAYRAEGTRLVHISAREQSTDHVSVFKYST